MTKVVITFEYNPNPDHYACGVETPEQAAEVDLQRVLDGHVYLHELLDGVDAFRYEIIGCNSNEIEYIEVAEMLSFTLGTAVKYISRFGNENGLEDLRTAAWYLQRTLQNGCYSHLPFKARKKLTAILAVEPPGTRRTLLTLVNSGDLSAAIAEINNQIIPPLTAAE